MGVTCLAAGRAATGSAHRSIPKFDSRCSANFGTCAFRIPNASFCASKTSVRSIISAYGNGATRSIPNVKVACF